MYYGQRELVCCFIHVYFRFEAKRDSSLLPRLARLPIPRQVGPIRWGRYSFGAMHSSWLSPHLHAYTLRLRDKDSIASWRLRLQNIVLLAPYQGPWP